MSRLYQIQSSVHERAARVVAAHPEWPCRKGCDDCCRHLASVPLVSEAEWRLIAAALDALPGDIADALRRRIQASASASRPVTCPLLDTAEGACLVYHARPVACRAYGFYAERESVLGCSRIESLAAHSPDVVWGNHTALEQDLDSLGPAAPLYDWISRPEC